jgi:hypothetical protein
MAHAAGSAVYAYAAWGDNPTAAVARVSLESGQADAGGRRLGERQFRGRR